MKKKIVSLLLAAVCFGSVFPGTVFAEEPAETETVYTLGEKELTVADVIAFSNMNRVLQWADFTDYSGEILHLKNKLWETEWQFAVKDGEDGLMLRICGSTDKFPAHIYLSDSSKRQIDIRSDDVQSFLNKGAGEDSLTVSEEVKEHFRVYETYSDEFTKPERRLVQDFKSIMRYYNVPLRGAFTEFDNIDDVLASASVLKKYYVVEYEDGSVRFYDEHLNEMKSNSYTIRNGERVALPYLTLPEKAWNVFYNADFAKTYIAPDAQVENVYWLSGESSMMGTAIYYRTSVGDYVYYYYHTIGETLFPVSEFCAYQQAIKDEIAKYPESGGGINIADVWDLTDYRLKANISGIMGDVNNDGAFNVSDVVLLQKWLLAVPDTHLANWKAADFCEDNKLDVFDLCLMKRALIYKSDVAVRDSNSIAGKTFTYEKSADPGIYDDLCDLSFGSNGTYIYHIGYYTSNNHDQGTWKISGDTLVLTGRYGINKFRYENNALVYIADGSDGFSEFNDKSTPKDGDKFNLAEEPDYAAINNLSEIVTIKTDYNPIMSDWSGIGILLEFDSKDYSISLRTNDGHFTTWDIAKGSGPIKNAGVTYDIGNSGYIFWTPDGFEFDADYQNEIVIIGEKDVKSVKLGSISVTPSNNHTLTAALK